MLCQAPTNRIHSLFIRILFLSAHVRACMRVHKCIQAHPCVLHTNHGMNGPANHFYSFSCFPCLSYLFSLIPSLPLCSFLCSARRAVVKECDNRGINQMYIELAWLAQSMWCFYLPNAMWIGLLVPEKRLCEHLEWAAFYRLSWPGSTYPAPAPSKCTQFFIFIST